MDGTYDFVVPSFYIPGYGDTEDLVIRMPYVEIIAALVDWTLDHWSVDLSELTSWICDRVLPDKPECYRHPELIEKMSEIPGAEIELDFLTHPNGIRGEGVSGTTYTGVTTTNTSYAPPRSM